MANSWRPVLTAIAVTATLLALYLQIFDGRAHREEDREAAERLESALDASRARLKAEILAELRAELADQAETPARSAQPLPNTVLRRLESGSLRQTANPLNPETLSRMNGDFVSLASQVEMSNRALRRDLEALRSAASRQSEVAFRVTVLILVALISLLVLLLLTGPRSGSAP